MLIIHKIVWINYNDIFIVAGKQTLENSQKNQWENPHGIYKPCHEGNSLMTEINYSKWLITNEFLLIPKLQLVVRSIDFYALVVSNKYLELCFGDCSENQSQKFPSVLTYTLSCLNNSLNKKSLFVSHYYLDAIDKFIAIGQNIFQNVMKRSNFP